MRSGWGEVREVRVRSGRRGEELGGVDSHGKDIRNWMHNE